MKYLAILLLVFMSVYPLSYAKYNWDKNNILGAIGTFILVIEAVIATALFLLLR